MRASSTKSVVRQWGFLTRGDPWDSSFCATVLPGKWGRQTVAPSRVVSCVGWDWNCPSVTIGCGRGAWSQKCRQPLRAQTPAQLRQKCRTCQLPGPRGPVETGESWRGGSKVGRESMSWQQLASEEMGPDRPWNLLSGVYKLFSGTWSRCWRMPLSSPPTRLREVREECVITSHAAGRSQV